MLRFTFTCLLVLPNWISCILGSTNPKTKIVNSHHNTNYFNGQFRDEMLDWSFKSAWSCTYMLSVIKKTIVCLRYFNSIDIFKKFHLKWSLLSVIMKSCTLPQTFSWKIFMAFFKTSQNCCVLFSFHPFSVDFFALFDFYPLPVHFFSFLACTDILENFSSSLFWNMKKN